MFAGDTLQIALLTLPLLTSADGCQTGGRLKNLRFMNVLHFRTFCAALRVLCLLSSACSCFAVPLVTLSFLRDVMNYTSNWSIYLQSPLSQFVGYFRQLFLQDSILSSHFFKVNLGNKM